MASGNSSSSSSKSRCDSLIDPEWELIDPNPDIWALFQQFDERFFWGTLKREFVELQWSSCRMTSTAGLCAWNPRTNFALIKLSKPLLTLRSRADLVETLIHEMIHAYLFVTREDDNHESHGPKFHEHMYRINKLSGTNITVYHTFHDEVRHFQKHVWQCNGPCRNKPPYHGYVRRAANRAPGPTDFWWSQHSATCNGTFVKISEPEKVDKPTKSSNKTTKNDMPPPNNHRIDEFFHPSPEKSKSTTNTPQSSAAGNVNRLGQVKREPSSPNKDIRSFFVPHKVPKIESNFVPFTGKGSHLGSTSSNSQPSSCLMPFNHLKPSSAAARAAIERISRNVSGGLKSFEPKKVKKSANDENDVLPFQESSRTSSIRPIKNLKKEPIEITID
ncbi:DNA-dependent metalloprotease SPRTN [Brevipalpus obovatus]|uniref:DNA-dependent metalloprotease SPRTN n=1 Tax=Brevipalpus obovatus TaxID=246614 RepID=UPI003D9EAA13